MTNNNTVNCPMPQVDALEKVKGTQIFMSDLRLPNMLWGKVVRSERAHAKIKKINTDKALSISGVIAVLTADDIQHIPNGPFIPDWEILAREKVVFVGQEVACVAAESYEASVAGARAVEVEYEDLPAVFESEEALKEDAPLVHPERGNNIAFEFDVEKGDVDKAFAESAFVREEEFNTSSAFHAYLEPNGSIASYDEENDSFTIWAATQVPLKARTLYSKALGIPLEKLRLIQMPMGGGFGGKFESNFHLVAAALSRKVKRPVRLVNTMEEEFYTAPLRVPMKIKIKMGIDQQGHITAKETTVIADNGGRTSYGPAVVSTTCFRVDSLYKIFNTRAKGYLMYTNNVSKGAMRGFGNPQMIFAVESMLDMLSEDAGLDKVEVRKKNAFCNGEVSVHGWEINSCGLVECIDKAVIASNWHQKQLEKKPADVRIKRGLGIACCNHVSSYRPIFPAYDGSIAQISMDKSAIATVFSGEVDIGQGYNTVVSQITAETVGLSCEQVKIGAVDSDCCTLGIGSLASRGTLMGGNAVYQAALALKEKLLELLAPLLKSKKEDISFQQGKVFKNQNQEVGTLQDLLLQLDAKVFPIVAEGKYMPNTVFPDPKTKYGNPSPAYSFAAHIAEVEVDTATGKVQVINYTAANDVGKAINPLLCSGQLEGGVLQGIGWALGEQIFTSNGWIRNSNLLDYKMLTFADMVDVKTLLIEENDPNGPYGAKSIGEPAFNPVATAVINAIYDAVGIRITKIPVLAEELLEAIVLNQKKI